MEITDLLTQLKAKREEIGTKQLADALGVSDVTIRSVCTGNYRGKPDAILAAFAAKYIDVVLCPYIDDLINRADCKTRSNGPKPFGGATKLAWWQTCQTCNHKGE